jgi:hypothetical protein
MKTLSKALAKGTIATVAAGAMVMGTATPALAQHRDRDDGIDAGDVIAGALIIGGIAAVAAAASNNDNRRYNDGRYHNGRYYDNDYRGYDNRYDNRHYNRAGDSRQAVEQCVHAAQRNASRHSYGGQARVTDIRKIDRKRDGYEVRGRIAVNTRNADWRRGWGNDYRGWNNSYRGYDAGTFECRVRYGQVVDLDYDNIRGLG